jgi:hypothetical protein
LHGVAQPVAVVRALSAKDLTGRRLRSHGLGCGSRCGLRHGLRCGTRNSGLPARRGLQALSRLRTQRCRRGMTHTGSCRAARLVRTRPDG